MKYSWGQIFKNIILLKWDFNLNVKRLFTVIHGNSLR